MVPTELPFSYDILFDWKVVSIIDRVYSIACSSALNIVAAFDKFPRDRHYKIKRTILA